MRHIKCLCFLTILSLSIACSRKPSDETIAQDIDKKVAAEAEVQPAQVQVEAKAGKVTLKGKAKSEAARQAVEKIAMEESGVTSSRRSSRGRTRRGCLYAAGIGLRATCSGAKPRSSSPASAASETGHCPGGNSSDHTHRAVSGIQDQLGWHRIYRVRCHPNHHRGQDGYPGRIPDHGNCERGEESRTLQRSGGSGSHHQFRHCQGHQYNIETESFDQTSTGKGKRTAGMVVGGTGVGAAIGGLAGGGKGAAIGALVGAGAGTVGAATGKRDIDLPAESALAFRLLQPLTLKPDSTN